MPHRQEQLAAAEAVGGEEGDVGGQVVAGSQDERCHQRQRLACSCAPAFRSLDSDGLGVTGPLWCLPHLGLQVDCLTATLLSVSWASSELSSGQAGGVNAQSMS